MERRHNEPVFYHIGQGVRRPGGTRVDVRRWTYAALILAFFGLAAWLYLEQATVAASYGADVRRLQDDKERLRKEITALRADVAVAGSLTRLNALAAEMGYVLPDSTDASRRLVISYVPPPAALMDESAPDGSLPSEEGSALMRRVQGWVSQLRAWLGTSGAARTSP